MSEEDTPGEVYRDEIARVNDYLERFGKSVSADLEPLDQDGYTDVRHGTLVIGINAAPAHGILMLVVKMGELPDNPEPAFYRRLLELNFTATGDCAFAIDKRRRTIYLRAMRRLAGLEYGEFDNRLRTTASVAEEMRDLFIERAQAHAERAV